MLKKSLLVLLLALSLYILIKMNHPPNKYFDIPDEPVFQPFIISSPKASGNLLRVFTYIMETWPLNQVIVRSIYERSGIYSPVALADKLNVAPTFLPVVAPIKVYEDSTDPKDLTTVVKRNKNPGFNWNSISDYAEAYRAGTLTPLQVAERAIEQVKKSDESNPPLRSIIAMHTDVVIKHARASTERFKEGKPLSIFDGILIAVKDEFDVEGFSTCVGTKILCELNGISKNNSEIVDRLVKLGAIVLGKTNMHEVGLGVTGANYHWGTPRNPYNTSCYTGGSSAGSASAVAAGLVPLAIGADGGGSIRIPSSLNGIVGLKPTAGRISSYGKRPLGWTVGVSGPMGSSVHDVALGYLATLGPDPRDPKTLIQPKNDFSLQDLKTLPKSLKIGVFYPWLEYAKCQQIKKTVLNILDKLKQANIEVVSIEIPHLMIISKAHQITITSEGQSTMQKIIQTHLSNFSYESRVIWAAMDSIPARDYVSAQKVRTHGINLMNEVFQKVDLLVVPSTGITAPFIPPESLQYGMSDLEMLEQIMLYSPLANFVGIPGISVPAGYSSQGLPIGVQFMAGHWNEKLLFQIASYVESIVERKEPTAYYPVKL